MYDKVKVTCQGHLYRSMKFLLNLHLLVISMLKKFEGNIIASFCDTVEQMMCFSMVENIKFLLGMNTVRPP